MSGARRIETEEDFVAEYPRVRQWLLDAALRSGNPDERHIIEAIGSGDWTLWTSPGAAATTDFIEWEGRKALVFVLAGGNLDEILNVGAPAIEAWARENECKTTMLFGRRGWERKMKQTGYEYVATVLAKEIDVIRRT